MKVLVSDHLEQSCSDILMREGFEVDKRPGLSGKELESVIGEYDALVVRSATTVTAGLITAAAKMKVIGRAGTGVDNIDVQAATRKGILVLNTPGGNTISAAEHTVSMLLSLARNIPQANMSMTNGRWERKKYIGTEVTGKTIGIVGLGKIGREVALRCRGLAMKVVGFDPILSPDVALKLNIELASLDDLFRRADFITFHTPLTRDTRGLLNDDSFAKCKRGVRIVNCARGGIVDEEALIRALESGQVGGAALDVFEKEPPIRNPLVGHEKVIVTPHLGASTEEAQEKVAIQIAHEIADALKGRGYAGVVNSDALHLAMNDGVKPYLALAEKLGSFVGQMASGKLKRIGLGVGGEIVTNSLELLKAAVLKGILSRVVQEPVNIINALFLAAEMGLGIDEQRERTPEDYQNIIRVRYETEVGNREVAGTVFGSSLPRLVKMDGFRFEVRPEGKLLIYNNVDKPGMLARVGSVLAGHRVNIAGVSLGRTAVGANALTVMNIDNEISSQVMNELFHLDGIDNLKLIVLD